MPRASPRLLRRPADIAIPWGVGVFLVLVVVDKQATPTWVLPLSLGVAAGVVQGLALRWRHRYPVRVMAVCLAGGLLTLLVAGHRPAAAGVDLRAGRPCPAGLDRDTLLRRRRAAGAPATSSRS